MKIGKYAASALVAASFVGAPIVAQAAPSEVSRASSEFEGENMRGGFIIPVIAIIAVLLGILAATSGGGDAPHSP